MGRWGGGGANRAKGLRVLEGRVMPPPPIQFAPRLGFAWDVTGDGRTAVRGGGGIFYDRYSDDEILQLVEQYPLLDTRTTNFTTVSALLSNQLTASPKSTRYIPDFIPPVVYNWSIGVQREVGFRTAVDVAYV